MTKQKPLAFINEFKENTYHLVGLFTADQLKEEREAAIRECMAIPEQFISNINLKLDPDTTDEERSLMYDVLNSVKMQCLALLSNDESKENLSKSQLFRLKVQKGEK